MPGKPSQIASVVVDKAPHNLDPLSLQPSPRGPRPPSGPAWPVERPPKACSHAMEGRRHQRPVTVDLAHVDRTVPRAYGSVGLVWEVARAELPMRMLTGGATIEGWKRTPDGVSTRTSLESTGQRRSPCWPLTASTTGSPTALRMSFENSAHVVFAWAGDELAGMARLLSDGVCNAYLLDVWTRSSLRRQGIATAMLHRLQQQVPGQHIGLQTDDAAPFYIRLGFRRQPEFMSLVIGRWLDNDANRAVT
jgi:hypothetical protein